MRNADLYDSHALSSGFIRASFLWERSQPFREKFPDPIAKFELQRKPLGRCAGKQLRSNSFAGVIVRVCALVGLSLVLPQWPASLILVFLIVRNFECCPSNRNYI